MYPNQNFMKYFPETELPNEKNRSGRSSCLRIGAYIVIRKILNDYGLIDLLKNYFSEKDCGLFLDFIAYTIVCENNAGQYYPDYAYNHPLFTNEMRIYSDSKLSDFLNSITKDQSIQFLNHWNESKDHREKIYISYDSTNKSSQAGEIRIVEYGKAKNHKGLPIFNYSMAYDTTNREPLFYEEYPGSIVDISQLQFMLEKAKGYGYRRVGFILDRGYFSKQNIEFMDDSGYEFVIMVKGMADLVRDLVLENKDTFEDRRSCNIRRFKTYGKTVRRKLYASDKKDRYFHIFHSSRKESAQRETLEAKIEKMETLLKNQQGKPYTMPSTYEKYFEAIYFKPDEDDPIFVSAMEKEDAIERELKLCGYFVIVTSKKMTAAEALELYKRRDGLEKLFRGDKSYLGNQSLRVHSDESTTAKIFVEFVALIVRNKIYTCLKDEETRVDKKANYMTVPAALRELEKIEMTRQLDHVYRLDRAVTATQKAVLKAFGLNEVSIKYEAGKISEQLSAIHS